MTSSIFVSLLGTVPISFDELSVQRLCYGFRWLFSRYSSTLDVLSADMCSTGVLTLRSHHSIFWSKVLSSCSHVVWALSTLEKSYLSLKGDRHHDGDWVPPHQWLCFLLQYHTVLLTQPGKFSSLVVLVYLQSCLGILCHLYFHTNFRFCLSVSPKSPRGYNLEFFLSMHQYGECDPLNINSSNSQIQNIFSLIFVFLKFPLVLFCRFW